MVSTLPLRTALRTPACLLAHIAGIDSINLPHRWEQLCCHAAEVASASYAELARRHLPLLASVLDCHEVDTSGIRRADAGTFIHGVKLALRACCEITTHHTGKPAVLVIEDLQWMGGLREVIADLLQHACLPQPLIVIGTARPEFGTTNAQLSELVGEGAYRALILPPLAKTEGGQLMRALLPDVKLPPELAQDLERKANGVPYYYEEFARLALMQGLVVERDGRLELTVEKVEIELPADLRELIENRLARLEPELRDLTGRAAVIGRSFSGERLRKLEKALGLPAAKELIAELAELQQQQFIAREAGDRYFFEHVLAQSAAYVSVPPKARAELHRTMADTLKEIIAPGSVSEWDILPELIRHLAGCGRFKDAHEQACGLLYVMADLGKLDVCSIWFKHALELWKAHEEFTGDGSDWEDNLSFNSAPAEFPPSRMLHQTMSALCTLQGRYSKALAHGAVALELCRQPAESSYRWGALLALGDALFHVGRIEEARTHYEESLALVRKGAARVDEGRGISRLAQLHCEQGRWDEMRSCYKEHLAIARELGDRRTEATALRNIGRSYRIQGNLDEAKTYAERSVSMFREMGNRLGTGRSLHHLAEVLMAKGLTSKARTCLHESYAIAIEVEDRMSKVRNLTVMGLLHVHAGELELAEQVLAEAMVLDANSGFPHAGGLLHCALVHFHLAGMRKSAVSPDGIASTSEAVRRELGKAEACATQLSVAPESELGVEIAKARAAIEEFEREVGTASQAD